MTTAPAEIALRELHAHVGHERASAWLVVGQERVDRFAEVTGDGQWIHVDPDRARHESPYGATIAHGFLTLSLVSALMREVVHISGSRLTVNYGLNRVRFPAPVPTGARIRGRFTLVAVEPAGDARQATWSAVVEREGSDKPCCVAEWLVRYYA